MKQLTEKQAGCSIGRLRPCHVVCHLIHSRLAESVCLCYKWSNNCKQSRKRQSCANFSERLYISHRGVTIPIIFLTIPRQCLRRGLPDPTTARQHDRETSVESLHHVVVSNCQLGPTNAARDVAGMQGAPATWPCIPV
jgi:hypothetical protein